jgi:hypothetical protein
VAFLLKYGGVYADADIEPIVSLQQMVGPNDRFVTSSSSVPAHLNPHFIVARPGEPILASTLRTMLKHLGSARSNMSFLIGKYESWTVCVVLYDTLKRRWNGTIYQHGCGSSYADNIEPCNASQAARAARPCPEHDVRLLGEGSLHTLHEENHLRKVMMAPPDRVLAYTKYLTNADTGEWYISDDGMQVRKRVCADGRCAAEAVGPNCGRHAWRQGHGIGAYTIRGCSDGNWSMPRCLQHATKKECLT